MFRNMFKGRGLAIALGFILLIVLVLIFGSSIGLSLTEKIFAAILILLVWIILLLFEQLQASRGAKQIEQSIMAQAEEQMQSIRPDKKEEIEQLNKQLQMAIDQLKKSRLGRGKLGKSALYALPWYMVIGPPAAGKTTAIQNSGLDFPYGKEVKGVGGTRNCDWFFSNRAIFLDTAGRYVSQVEDKEEWLAFLDILKKNRRKRPINGVVVGISINEIVQPDLEKLDEHARKIRQRIDELILHLGVKFPVYLVFTKCDLIKGFVEFFGDFSQSERNQIWGASFTHKQQTMGMSQNIFEEEFDKLTEKIMDMRMLRLGMPLNSSQRTAVYLFPVQFASLKEKLSYFVERLLAHNPYSDDPIFRGFYFTSGTQEENPLYIALDEISSILDIFESQEPQPERSLERFEIKNYFIRNFFNKVIIRDQNLYVGHTSRAEMIKRLTRLAIITGSLLLLGLLFLKLVIDYRNGSNKLDILKDNITASKRIQWPGALTTNIQYADELRSTILNLESYTDDVHLLEWNKDDILGPARRLYFKRMNAFSDRYIFNRITDKLRQSVYSQRYTREQTYNTLKAYLLLGNEYKRLEQKSNKKFLTEELINMLEADPISGNSSVTVNDIEVLRQRLRDYVKFFVASVGKPGLMPIKNDEVLVRKIRNLLHESPSVAGIYDHIKRDGNDYFTADVSLEGAIGAKWSQLLQSDMQIPTIFSKQGWHSFIEKRIKEASENPGKEDWVLGADSENRMAGLNMDKEALEKALKSMYFREYNQRWWQFLRSIRYKPYGSISVASRNLMAISDPINSPLVQILKLVVRETTFSELQQNLAGKIPGEQAKQIVAGSIHPVDREFKSLHNFVFESKQTDILSSNLANCLQQLAFVSGALESISSDPGKGAYDKSVQIIESNSGELPQALNAIKALMYTLDLTASQILRRLFEEPIRMAWGAVIYKTQNYLNNEWRIRVYEPFSSTLANFYPFNKQGQDAPLNDIEEFFRPIDGIFWSFYNEQLNPFIENESWRVKRWEGKGIIISESTKRVLERAQNFSQTMFRGGEMGITFQLKPEIPISKEISMGKPIVEQTHLYLDGIDSYYNMGAPSWEDFSWPGREGSPGARLDITVRDIGGVKPIRFEGQWAFFRLLNEASTERITSSRFMLSWNFKNPGFYDITIKYLLQAESAKNPFSRDFLSAFHLPRGLN